MSFVGSYAMWAMPPPRKKQKKPKKAKASNWFEKCTVDQLKQLSKAALLPVSGTKDILTKRLLEGELTARFSFEYTPARFSFSDFNAGYICGDDYGMISKREKAPTGARRPDGVSTQYLKHECGEKGLVKSGTRFDLVLRILQNETSAETGVELQRAKNSVLNPETGKFEAKPRAKSMKLPDPYKLGERVGKKAYPSEEVMMKWSNYKSKYHLFDCMQLAKKLIQTEVVDKKLFQRGEEELAWQVVKEVTRWWVYRNGEIRHGNRGRIRGMGYCSWELKEYLSQMIDLVKLTTDKSQLVGIIPIFQDIPPYARSFSHNETIDKFEKEPKELLPDFEASPPGLC